MATNRDDVITKIKKLLKLAESSNVNEAATAASMAQSLMDRFEIEAACLEAEAPKTEPSEPVETFGEFESGGRVENWRGNLLNAIAMANGCQCYKTRMLGRQTELRVIGRKTDAQTVRYLYAAMASLVEGLAHSQRGAGRQFIASFKAGAAAAIAGRIREAKATTKAAVYQEAAQAGTAALMRIDNAVAVMKERDMALRMFVERMHLRSGGKTRVSHGDGYRAGQAAGMQANIGSGARPLGGGRSQLTV
jgi:hypothetical protein